MDSISSFFYILSYAIIYVSIHHIICGFIFTSEIFLIFSSTHVLTSSIDVVLVLSVGDSLTKHLPKHRKNVWLQNEFQNCKFDHEFHAQSPSKPRGTISKLVCIFC